ncbi:MAG: hypothetical protein RLZZ293_404 [Pseudomonadota bacterium]|jgi:outer membrane protein TolC
MKFKLFVVFSCSIFNIYAYNQSDLLNAQYSYQASSENLTKAKQAKTDAVDKLNNAQKNLQQKQQALKDAQQQLSQAKSDYNIAESTLVNANQQFDQANNKLNQIWNSVNSQN